MLSGAKRPRFGPADVITNSPLYMADTYKEELSVILMGCNKPVVGSRTNMLIKESNSLNILVESKIFSNHRYNKICLTYLKGISRELTLAV